MIKSVNLDKITDEELLKTRICDLPIAIEGTWLSECIDQLNDELKDKELDFTPLCYLADEWLTPERETCIGIPFYLAHPTLIRLEKKFMIDAEGDGRPRAVLCVSIPQPQAVAKNIWAVND